MNILKGVAETLLGKENDSFEEKKGKFETLEKSENKELLIKEPLEKETIVREEVVQHVIKPTEKIEVQPVINLEREKTEVHEIIQPLRKKEILPITVEKVDLPTIQKEEIRESDIQFKEEYKEATNLKSTTRVDNVKKEREMKAPIVHETIHKKVIEEIQPVIYKETIAPRLIEETQQINEKVVEAPVLVKETFNQKTDLEKLKKQGIDVESYKKKAITQETIKPREKTIVQPIVNLEREQTEIHEVIQPISKREVLPTRVDKLNLPTLEKEEVRESDFKKEYQQLVEEFQSNVQVEDVQKKRVVNAPIVKETIHKKVIEEIQPIIHKETIVPHLIKEEFTVNEKFIEAPKLIKEVLPERDLGTTYLGEESSIDRKTLEHKKLA